jgi:hypothetical protein
MPKRLLIGGLERVVVCADLYARDQSGKIIYKINDLYGTPVY